MFAFILNILSKLPHLNFKFKIIKSPFDVDFRSEYVQSLAIFAAISALVLVLLLLTIIITWICQCCSRHDASVKSRRKVKRLSTVLFVISVLCFFCLGFSLFGNDHINRGVAKSVTGLEDVTKGFKLAIAQGNTLTETCTNASSHLRSLEDVVHNKSKEKGVNQTLITQIDGTLTNISDTFDEITGKLRFLNTVLEEVSFLETTKTYGERIELERWLLIVFVQSIQMCVLFAGVISFCRQSKKGAVVFSALGFVIFLVVWTLLCFVFPATVALSDFCTNGTSYVHAHLGNSMIDTLDFYKTCDARPTHDNVPNTLGVKQVSDALSALQTSKTQLDSLLDAAFNRSAEVSNVSSIVSLDSSKALKSIGALESTLACYAYKDDVNAMHQGLCQQAVVGAAVLLLCLILLGILLFALLIIVSRSWKLFTRLPSDYVEVDEDDPFFPRTNDSTIPVDIYGTHVFNPRTRERTDPSTGTTSANTGGTSSDEVTQPLWQHNPTAPPVTNSYSRPYNDHPYGNYSTSHYDIQ